MSGGRGEPENVTCGRRRSVSAEPMPRTRSSASTEPNGPRRSRSSTIRAANAGPMPGRRSSSSTVATSTSTGVGGTSGVADAGVLDSTRRRRGAGARGSSGSVASAEPRPVTAPPSARARTLGLRPPPTVIAESTRASCWASAVRAAGSGAGRSTDRQARTATPRAATAATKIRAWRSAGVGTAGSCARRHRGPSSRRCPSYLFHTSYMIMFKLRTL